MHTEKYRVYMSYRAFYGGLGVFMKKWLNHYILQCPRNIPGEGELVGIAGNLFGYRLTAEVRNSNFKIKKLPRLA